MRSYIVPALEYIGDELNSKESQHSSATKATDIFISHADIERAVALELQSFFQNAFGNHCSVFVSSDEKSMEPGDWFTHIVRSLKSSKAFVVLLSKYSFQREWINYETGIAEGSSTWVDASGLAKNIFPIVIRGFPKGAVSWPLSHYQIKDLHGEGEVRWILEHIAEIIGLEVQKTSISEFIQKITNVEKRLPTRGIQLRPFVSKPHPHIVNFELRNGGTTDYELVEVWVAVLRRLVPNHRDLQVPPAFLVSEETIDGELYLKKRLIVCSEALNPYYERSNFERLRPLFVPSMSPKHLPDLSFPVNQNLTEDDRTNPLIQFQITARNLSAEEGRVFHVSLAEIDRDS